MWWSGVNMVSSNDRRKLDEKLISPLWGKPRLLKTFFNQLLLFETHQSFPV